MAQRVLENLIHTFHYRVIQEVFIAVVALKDRQILQDNNGCLIDFEGKICDQ
jgi:hypothetical protein